MTELIHITEREGQRVVSARELYKFLNPSERFSAWMDRQLQYGFTEGVDYQGCKEFNALANQELTDYALTIDTAKEISMLQKSPRGKQARQYFIECEKRLIARPELTRMELIKLAMEAEQERERLAEVAAAQEHQLKLQAPKVEEYDKVLAADGTFTTNQIAKELGMSAVSLNRILNERGVQYKQGEQWLLYHKYQNLGYTKTKTARFTDANGNERVSMLTVWTSAGRLFIHRFLNPLKKIA